MVACVKWDFAIKFQDVAAPILLEPKRPREIARWIHHRRLIAFVVAADQLQPLAARSRQANSVKEARSPATPHPGHRPRGEREGSAGRVPLVRCRVPGFLPIFLLRQLLSSLLCRGLGRHVTCRHTLIGCVTDVTGVTAPEKPGVTSVTCDAMYL